MVRNLVIFCCAMHFINHHVLQLLIEHWSEEDERLERFTGDSRIHNLISTTIKTHLL